VERNGALYCSKVAGEQAWAEESDIILLGELICSAGVTVKNERN